MHVSEVMSRDVRMVNPDQTIREAAKLMAQIDAGALPVGEDDRLVGMITDRDIVVRAIGDGNGPDTPIREVMSRDIKYCFEDEDVEDVSKNMADLQLRRLPVVDSDKRLVGIVAVSDIAGATQPETAGNMIQSISQP